MPFEEYCSTTVKSMTNDAFEIKNFELNRFVFAKQIYLNSKFCFNQAKTKVKKQIKAVFYPKTFSTCHDYDHK